MHDLVIDNARIVDGTGGPSRHGSVAVQGGRIVEVGGASGQLARERLDAHGRVLAPGFIDPHTHYDAQVSWDPLVTCSSWHGVTTVVTGNCGVGVAPCRREARETLMFARPSYELSPTHELPTSLTRAAARVGQATGVVGMSFWTDAAVLGAAGIPSVLFGPGGAGLHSVEEYVNVDDVLACRDALAALALNPPQV